MESESTCDFSSVSASSSRGEEARDPNHQTSSADNTNTTMNSCCSPAVHPEVAEVSPGGEGASCSPNHRDRNGDDDHHHYQLQQQDEVEEHYGDAEDGDAVGFGPPPAFPNSNGKLHAGKRKRTLIAVSSASVVAAGATSGGKNALLLDQVSSDEEEMEEGRPVRRGGKYTKQSQMIHRIKPSTEEGSAPLPRNHSHEQNKTREDCIDEQDDGAKSYIDAMLLASLSDVDSSPKRLEEFANAAAAAAASSHKNLLADSSNNRHQDSFVAGETNGCAQATMTEISTDSPRATTHIGTSATAPTPLRSNVNLVKPYALMPKPNKRGKFASSSVANSSAAVDSSAAHPPAHWPDVREPKADKLNKNERGAVRDDGPHCPPPPTPQPLPSSSQYPMGYSPYPYHQYPPQTYAAPPTSEAAAAAGYATFPPPPPPRGPSSSIPYAHILQYGASSSPFHHHPSTRSYYPGGGPPVLVGTPDRWDQYPPPPPPSSSTTTTTLTTQRDPNKQTGTAAAGWTPESIHSSSTSSRSRNKSHVVPSEDGDQQPVGSAVEGGAARGGVVHRPYPGAVAGPPPPPPPPGYPYAMYHGPATRDGHYPAGPPPHLPPPPPPPHEYKTISGDDGSPPRSTAPSSSHQHYRHHHGGSDGRHGDYYNPTVSTPPRGGGGHFEYYHDQSPQHAVPGSYNGGYPPPPQGYHPDSPMTSMYPHHNAHPPPPTYGAAPPPSQFAHPHDSYDPYTYHAMNSPSSFAKDGHPQQHHHHHHEDVSAVVSSETEGGGGVVMLTKNHQFRKGGRSIHSAPIILRKKFSWRNYAELEEYLIANRAEYLRYSALNYSAEQKHFNNQLTEGLLELAAKLNYVFDETCFNFVTVRDRIRCYYKSYVQSSKKRGVVVGYSNKAQLCGDGCSE